MKDLIYDLDDPICALATPWGESAIAAVRTSGKGSIEMTASVFRGKRDILKAKGYTLFFGELFDPETGETVDEVNLAVYRNPVSYTGQDSVEIFCHGSLPGIEAVLELLRKAGFRDAGPGEFTLRAFLNKKIDLTQAEAVQEIISSKSKQAHKLALHRLSGAIETKINTLKEKALSLSAVVEIQLDYPGDEIEDPVDIPEAKIDEIHQGITELLNTYRAGKVYQEGVVTVLAGATNSGKSSLFNLFLKEDRSIVSDVHGTTRDYIESWISIDGVPVVLYDTAGLRQADNPVEEEGIRRSENIISNAQVIIYVVDSTKGLSEKDRIFLTDEPPNCIKVWNKTDLDVESAPEGFIGLSAITGEGFPLIEDRIKTLALGEGGGTADVVVDSQRQKDLLDKALQAVEHVRQGVRMGVSLDGVAMDLKDLLDALGEITGEVTSADVLNKMFSDFCVGK